MQTLFSLLKMAAVLAAGLVLGRMFFEEVKRAKRTGAPWHAPYRSLPGILVLVAIGLPFIVWLYGRLR